MSNKKYFNQCKRKLENEETILKKRIKEKLLSLVLDKNELTELCSHTSEEIRFEERMRLNVLDVHKLGKIKCALWRLHSGSYGDCSKCNSSIEEKRLLANPSCTKCFSCRKKEDLKKPQRFFGNELVFSLSC